MDSWNTVLLLLVNGFGCVDTKCYYIKLNSMRRSFISPMAFIVGVSSVLTSYMVSVGAIPLMLRLVQAI